MKKLIYLLCITLSFTSISFLKIGMAEFTLFHALVLVVLFFLSFIAIKTNKVSIKIPKNLLLATVFLSCVNIAHFSSIKASSFLFSIIIIIEIVLVYNFIRKFSSEEIVKIMKVIVLVYFINIVISYFFITIGYMPQGIIGEIFQIYDFDHRIRPYGFSDEPSYAALILVFTLFVLFKSQNFTYNKKEFKWYAMASVAILLTGSSYGYLLLGLLLGYFVLKSNYLFLQLGLVLKSRIFTKKQFFFGGIIFVVMLFFAFNVIDFSKNKSVKRLISIFVSFTSSDDKGIGTIRKISYVDGSASMRLVPSILLIDNFKKSEWTSVLFGRGAGSSIPFFSLSYEGNTTVLGFIPSFIYNYGICGAIIFMFFFYSLFPKRKLLLFILFLLFILNADFNTQIFIYVLFSIMACKRIELLNEQKQKLEIDA